MKYWTFKAFNSQYHVRHGIAHGDAPDNIILQVRQQGWQIFDMRTIDEATYKRECYLAQKQRQVENQTKSQPTSAPRLRDVIVSCVLLVAMIAVTLFVLRL